MLLGQPEKPLFLISFGIICSVNLLKPPCFPGCGIMELIENLLMNQGRVGPAFA